MHDLSISCLLSIIQMEAKIFHKFYILFEVATLLRILILTFNPQ